MFLKTIDISNDSLITDLVTKDYRAAGVFRKYGIDYCCGGKLPLQRVCEMRGLETEIIKKELADAIRVIEIPASTQFNEWSVDFLADYIINVHHSYLVTNFQDITDTLGRFVKAHQSKYAYLPLLLELVNGLRDNLLPHLQQEEEIIFPYIKQISHAYEKHEPYAALFVRTLRKPIDNIMQHEHEHIAKYLHQSRELTSNYTPVTNACTSHKVAFSKLMELDNDLVQHIHLERNILLPRAIAMEKEMLALK